MPSRVSRLPTMLPHRCWKSIDATRGGASSCRFDGLTLTRLGDSRFNSHCRAACELIRANARKRFRQSFRKDVRVTRRQTLIFVGVSRQMVFPEMEFST